MVIYLSPCVEQEIPDQQRSRTQNTFYHSLHSQHYYTDLCRYAAAHIFAQRDQGRWSLGWILLILCTHMLSGRPLKGSGLFVVKERG